MYRKSVEATLAKCAELSVPVISYFPLANGLLSGRYDADNLPKFPKSLTMKKYVVGGADGFPDGGYTPLLRELQRIAAARGVGASGVHQLRGLEGSNPDPGREERGDGGGKHGRDGMATKRGGGGRAGGGSGCDRVRVLLGRLQAGMS